MNAVAQFRALVRAFTRRFVEHELLASSGDVREAVANVIAILAAFGGAVSYLLLIKHIFRLPRSRAEIALAAWTDQEFVITIAIAVAGLFILICWETLFPDRTDCLVVSTLPVATATVFAAKLGAVFRVFALFALSAAAVPLIALPALLASGTGRPFTLWFTAQFAAVLGASVFVFTAAVALQGLLMNVLSYRMFRRTSAYIQFLLLIAVLAMFFATPDIRRPEDLARPGMALLPAFWFVGLYHAVAGTPSPEAWALAHYAVYGIAFALLVAVVTYSFGYGRFVRRAVEESGLAPAPPRKRFGRLRAFADRRVLGDARERAVFHFVRRTISRSRMHRLIFAGYLSVGLTYVLIGLASVADTRPGPALASAPLALSFFALLGLRILFSVPVDLGANWVFRITERPRPTAELSAVWKLMLVVGVAPAIAVSLPVYWFLWGPGLALRHTTLVLLLALIALEAILGGFRKIPFTCSYLPGKSNLKMMFVVYGVSFSSMAWLVTRAELWAASDPLRFALAATACSAVVAMLIRRRRGERGWIGFMYDEKPDWQAISLEFT